VALAAYLLLHLAINGLLRIFAQRRDYGLTRRFQVLRFRFSGS
jgi:hypothetical protein